MEQLESEQMGIITSNKMASGYICDKGIIVNMELPHKY